MNKRTKKAETSNPLLQALTSAIESGAIEKITEEMAPGLNRNARRGLFVCLGRGRTGKTVLLRMLIELIKQDASRNLKVIDLETVNSGLHKVMDDIIHLDTPLQNAAELIELLMPYVEALVGTDDTLLIDTEGNSTLFADAFFEADMLDVLRKMGIEVHIIVVCGSEPDDRRGLELLATAFGDSEPPNVYVAVPDRLLTPRHRIDKDALAHDLLGADVMNRLNVKQLIYLPTCPPISLLDDIKISYHAAASDVGPKNEANPTHLLHRSMIGRFIQRMKLLLGDLV